jgi:hypothetical protein
MGPKVGRDEAPANPKKEPESRRVSGYSVTDFRADRMKAFELQIQHCLAMYLSWLLDSDSRLLLKISGNSSLAPPYELALE